MIHPSSHRLRAPIQGVIVKIAFLGSERSEASESEDQKMIDLQPGYGVIQSVDGQQYYFDERSCPGNFSQLRQGVSVLFDIEPGIIGRATSITRNVLILESQTTVQTSEERTPMSGESKLPIEHDEVVRAVLRQTEVEFAGIGHAEAALRVCLDWQTEGDTFSRKLSGVRHAFRVFAEQLDRVFAIEEHDGMADLLEEYPHFRVQVETLFSEHDILRDTIDVLMMRLERCLSSDQASFSEIQDGIRSVLVHVKRHMAKESKLIMDAFNTDIGFGD